MSFNDLVNVSVKENVHRIHFWYMSKDEAIDLLKNADLTEKVEYYEAYKFIVEYKRWVKNYDV